MGGKLIYKIQLFAFFHNNLYIVNGEPMKMPFPLIIVKVHEGIYE